MLIPELSVPLKLLTLNIHKGFTTFNRRFVLHELREAVRGVGADIVFLQEVIGDHARHAQRHSAWPAAPQYEFLADQIWKDHAYGRNAVYTDGHHGNALLSKFPIARWDNHDISIGGPEKRGLLHCELQLPDSGRRLHTLCVHLSLTEAHRRVQVERLCALVRERVPPEAPLLVAGDFNDWRGRAHRALEHGAGLREAFVAQQGRAARTFPARLPLLRLDRIYLRNARALTLQKLSARPWSHLSDHAALAAEIEL